MLRQAGLLVSGNLISRMIFALVTIALARRMSPGGYGAFSYALAVVSFASYFCELGLQNTYLRDAAGRLAGWRECSMTALYIRVGLALVVCGVVGVTLPWLVTNPLSRQCVAWMLIPGVMGTMLTNWTTGVMLSRSDSTAIFRARLRAAAAQFACVAIGLLLPVVDDVAKARTVALAYGLGLFLGGLCGTRSLKIQSIHLRLNRARHFAMRLIKGLHAYMASGFLYMLAPNLGVLILGKSTDLAIVGTFALASRVPQFLYTIPGAVGQAFYPRLFQATRENRQKVWTDLLFKEVIFLLVTGVLLAGSVLVSAPLILAILGQRHDPAYGAALKTAVLIGAAMIFIQSLSAPLGHALETSERAHLRTYAQAFALIVGGILFHELGNRYGVVGAMAAAVSMESIFYLGCLMFLAPGMNRTDAKRIFLPSISVAGCVLAGCAAILM
ncbi:lipopolysaccharide biosynthesis protein [Paraburkholderia sabiae]|nr:lipopolysaccharide biosynthesis protein [Paraburkholderia sabiae]WJZ79701.1 lipopolysaccharide biosynthesis protein [Paraburkholderia sabiae]